VAFVNQLIRFIWDAKFDKIKATLDQPIELLMLGLATGHHNNETFDKKPIKF